MKIVCDTSVWYNIGEEKISINEIDVEQLFGNYLVVSELVSTQRLHEDFQKAKCAIRAIMKTAEIIWHTPFEHILLIEDPGRQVRFPENTVMKHEFLRRIDRGWNPDDETMHHLKELAEETYADKKSSSDFVNNSLIDIRSKIKNRKEHLKGNGSENNRKWILSLLAQYENKEIPNLSESTWAHIEFFMGMLDSFFRKLETTENMKYKPNDWFDLFMLVYVQPEDKFWTFETKWQSLAKDNEVLEKYFYQYKT